MCSTPLRLKAVRLLAMCALSLASVLIVSEASAEAEAWDGQNRVRITRSPCSNPLVLRRVPASVAANLFQAWVDFEGVRYTPCWRPSGVIIQLLYEDGDEGAIPASALRPVRLT